LLSQTKIRPTFFGQQLPAAGFNLS
jgi:hypothetical protein